MWLHNYSVGDSDGRWSAICWGDIFSFSRHPTLYWNFTTVIKFHCESHNVPVQSAVRLES